MTTPVTDGKMLVNATYHSAMVSGLAIGYARIAKMITKATPPKLGFNGYDIGMVILDIGLAMTTNDMLIKQGLILEDIMK